MPRAILVAFQQKKHGSQGPLEHSPQQTAPATRRDWFGGSPSSLIQRLNRDFDRMYRSFFGSDPFRLAELPDWLTGASDSGFWPDVEVHHSDNKFVVQADVPGLKKDDISVEVRENELFISGERHQESAKKEGHFYRTERSYGRFSRSIPLPENAKPDTAAATFENGVLRIEMDAPSTQAQGRKIDVREGSPH